MCFPVTGIKKRRHRAVFKDGWFHTGDMGRRDEDGFVYIVGRKVEMIISSGENIYPVEVERALQSLPGIKEAAVVGMPDPKRGEVVGAFVIPKKDMPHIGDGNSAMRFRGKSPITKFPNGYFLSRNFRAIKAERF